MKTIIRDQLKTHGWEPGSSVIATKTFEVKDWKTVALVFVANNAELTHGVLSGQYMVDGCNVLSDSDVLIPKNFSVKDVRKCVDQFAESVDRVIRNAYSRYLLAA